MSRLTIIILLIISVLQNDFLLAQNFEFEQLKKARVKTAYNNNKVQLEKDLDQFGIKLSEVNVFLRGFKLEKKLELWVKHKDTSCYKLFRTYDFCVLSGTIGPKKSKATYRFLKDIIGLTGLILGQHFT